MEPAWTEKAERYLSGEMDARERALFEAELLVNEALRHDLELYKSIDKTMSSTANENELRQTLKQMNEKYFAGTGIVKKGNFIKWMAAAAVLVVILAAGYYYLLPSKPAADKLYAQFARHESLNLLQRGNKTDSLAATAAAAFNSKKYLVALTPLQEYLKEQPDDIQARFSLAVCYLETGAHADAEKIFSSVASGPTAYAETAKWYLALTALKKKDIPGCRKYLENIPETSPYFTKAKELLVKLPG